MKVSEDFDLREFIDPATYKLFGDQSIWMLDKRLITIAQFIRHRFDYPTTINNWHRGMAYKLSGFRPSTTSIGAKFSQHKFGRGEDVKMLGKPNNGADELREDIMNNFELYHELGLNTIEDAEFAPNWCHIDTRWTGLDYLFIVKPKE